MRTAARQRFAVWTFATLAVLAFASIVAMRRSAAAPAGDGPVVDSVAQRDAVRASASAPAALDSGVTARAADLYAALVASSPGEPVQRLAYAEALLAAGRFKAARVQFERLRGAEVGLRELGLPAARAAAADGDSAAAVAWLRSIPREFRTAEMARDPAFRSIANRSDFRALFE